MLARARTRLRSPPLIRLLHASAPRPALGAPQRQARSVDSQEEFLFLQSKFAAADQSLSDIPVVPVYVSGTLKQFRAQHPNLTSTAATWKHYYRYFYARVSEFLTSAYCVWNMSKFDAWPYGHPVRDRTMAALRILSTKDNAWNAGIRKEAGDSYAELNKAVASKNLADMQKYAAGVYLKRSEDTAKTSKRSEWNLVRHVKPVQLLSFRSMPFQDDNLSSRGNGWMFQGVFKFDTIQTLAPIVDSNSHQGERKIVDGKVALIRPPPPPAPTEHHIVEYLVLERRGWLPNRPWTIKARVKPGSHAGNHRLAEELGITKMWEVVDPATPAATPHATIPGSPSASVTALKKTPAEVYRQALLNPKDGELMTVDKLKQDTGKVTVPHGVEPAQAPPKGKQRVAYEQVPLPGGGPSKLARGGRM